MDHKPLHGSQGSSKSVTVHVDGRVSHVSLHAAAHATVADLLSAAVEASSPNFPATALSPRELAKGFACADTAGNRIDLSALALSVPPQLVVTHTATAGSGSGSSAGVVSFGTGHRGGRGGGAGRSAPSASSAVRGRGRGRGRERGRGGGRGRGSAAAVAKAQVAADAEEEGNDDTGASDDGEDAEFSSAAGEVSSDGATTEEDENGGTDSDGSSGGYSSDDESDNEEGEDEEEDGDNTNSSVTTASTSTTTTRSRGERGGATANSVRGRGRGRSGNGRGAGRTTAASSRGSSASPAPMAASATSARRSGSRSSSASPLLFTPDAAPVKRKRGRPPKSRLMAFPTTAVDAVAAPSGATLTAAGEGPPQRTRRSAKGSTVEATVEETKPRRGGRRRRADAEAEELEDKQRTSASLDLKDGGAAVTVAPADHDTGTISGTGRRGGCRRGGGDAVTKRSRSPSPSSWSYGSTGSTTIAAVPPTAAPAVTVVAVDGTGGGCASPLNPGAFATSASGATVDVAAAAASPSAPRARTVEALRQQQQRPLLKAQEQREQQPLLRLQQRRRARLTYNVFYPSSGLDAVVPATADTGGGGGVEGGTVGARVHRVRSAAEPTRFQGLSSAPVRPRYVWNGGSRCQQHNVSSLASATLPNEAQLGSCGTQTASSEAWVTLSSLLNDAAQRRCTAFAVSESPTNMPSSGRAGACERYIQAHRSMSCWRAEQHRTPSLLLSHPFSPLLMPGLCVYQHPSSQPASTPAPVAISADTNAAKPSTDRRNAVKVEVDDEEGSAESHHRRHHEREAAQHMTSAAAAASDADHGSSRVLCYPNQSLVVPVVVGGCVQLVNPESKDKSHQWTVYVRGLWNGHPEEVAGSNPRAPSSSHVQQLREFPPSPSSLTPTPSMGSRGIPGDSSAAANRDGGGGGVAACPSAAAFGAAGDSQTSVFSASTASPDDYLSEYIDKVVFVLDESFVPCVRTVASAPFELTEVGWGEFIVSMHVYLKVPVHTHASRQMQGKLLEYYCGFNGRTAMQTCDGRGTKPHDPVSTYVTGGARGPSHLWSALATPPPGASGTIPPTPAHPLHELRHRFHYDSLLDINSNSGARATYYRGPYLPLHLTTCDATSSTDSSSSSSDSGLDGGVSEDACGRSGSEVSVGGGSPTDSAQSLSFPIRSELSGNGSPSSSRSGSVTPSSVPASQPHAKSSPQQQEVRMGVTSTTHIGNSGSSVADGQPPVAMSAGVASAASPNPPPPPLQVPAVRRGAGRRPHRFGASRAGSGTSHSPAIAVAPGAGGSGGQQSFTEVRVGHGSNVVVLQHLLRFSHRPRHPASIPPARDPRTQGIHLELLGYTMVAEPVVTEQYDELVIPLEPFFAVAERRRSRASRRWQTTQRRRDQRVPKKPHAASVEANLHHLLAASSSLESHLRAALRRQLSLMCDDSPSRSMNALLPLSNSEAQALGHPGGISSWPHVLDYGNGIERDTSYTAAYLASIATSAEMEGWLPSALAARRAALFGAPAASCAWVATTDDAEELQLQRHGEASGGLKRGGEGREGAAKQLFVKVPTNSLIPSLNTSGTWMAALEYDMASALLRLAAGSSVATARDVFFHVVLPRADDIGAAVWCDIHEGVRAALSRANAMDSLSSGATGAAPLSTEPKLWRTSALQQEDEKNTSMTMGQALVGEGRGDRELLLVSSATALTRGYPLCSLRPTDTGIAALSNSLSSNSGSGCASAAHYPSQEALMASLLRDGQSRGSFGHDGDVAQLLAWKAALEEAIDAMRIEAARRQVSEVMGEL
ncbi:hypothetical protein JIQ42_07771 [Leishmania sp. Namibia]|uniref:hypothetical protein n=1 Tax=Leishmania sp. Namibia TaxID=2802991 RepID=UPI001B46B190|nr:hypothetical protein JIQ42_07771 [Leishmania sp. Namibia]